MKVAVVYPFFAHYRGSIIESLKNDFSFDFHFIGGTRKNGPYSSLKLYEFTDNDNFSEVKNYWMFNYFLWQKDLIRKIKDNNFDAVILFADWKYLSTWGVISYLRKRNIPFLFWSHGMLHDKPSITNKIKMFFFTLFDNGGFVYDNRAKRIMESKGYRNPLVVIYNSLDLDKQLQIVKSLDNTILDDDSKIKFPYVIFSGRIIKERKLEILFDALQSLSVKGIRINALIIGDGPHLEALKAYLNNLKVANQVIFYGSCYNEKLLAKFFINSIACVFPGPIGLTAIHSLTYGTPVITNDNIDMQKPEIEAVEEGMTGAFYKEGNAESLAVKIQYFNDLSSELRASFKENCINQVKEKFNAQNQHRIINKALHKILGTRLGNID